MTWNQNTLQQVLSAHDSWVTELEGDCLSISNEDGLDAFLIASEHQIVIETPLFPVSAVNDVSALNDTILRTHQLLPLTTVGIKSIGDADYYVAFGALSSDSKESVVEEEIEVLFSNVSDFLELYSEYLA